MNDVLKTKPHNIFLYTMCVMYLPTILMKSECGFVLCLCVVFSKAIYTAQLPRQTLRSQCAFVFLYQKRVYIIIIFVFRARCPCMLCASTVHFVQVNTSYRSTEHTHAYLYSINDGQPQLKCNVNVYTLKKFIYIGNCVDNLSLYRRRCACV